LKICTATPDKPSGINIHNLFQNNFYHMNRQFPTMSQTTVNKAELYNSNGLNFENKLKLTHSIEKIYIATSTQVVDHKFRMQNQKKVAV